MSTPLIEGWSIDDSASGLRLERSVVADHLTARRRLMTSAGSLMTAVALTLGGLQAAAGIGLIVWPLVGLFLLVAGLGVWAWWQARLAIANPIFLDVQPASRRITGLSSEPLTPLALSFDDIERVELVQEPGLTVPVVRLSVVTKAGLLFAGPELILSSDEARALLPHLTQAAQTLAMRLGCPVKKLD